LSRSSPSSENAIIFLLKGTFSLTSLSSTTIWCFLHNWLTDVRRLGTTLAKNVFHVDLSCLFSAARRARSAFDLRQVMDESRILLVNLAKGKIREDSAGLRGALLVSRIGLAALSHAELGEENRWDFHVYLDEFQNFTTLRLANRLSELRKYRVSLILAHQYLSQLDLQVRHAILGNVGTVISFRLGLVDAAMLENEFQPEISAIDLISLPNCQIYLKLMIQGGVSRVF